MKKAWKKIDAFLGKVSNWIIIAIIIIIIWLLICKQLIGRYMMYQDYYDNNIKSEQLK